jgi:hypothetical protein
MRLLLRRAVSDANAWTGFPAQNSKQLLTAFSYPDNAELPIRTGQISIRFVGFCYLRTKALPWSGGPILPSRRSPEISIVVTENSICMTGRMESGTLAPHG